MRARRATSCCSPTATASTPAATNTSATAALPSPGYGDQARRYDRAAERLTAEGAVVSAPDPHGHGRSDGERALAEDLEGAVDDLPLAAERAAADHPGLPVALIGHSMG